MPSNVNWIVKRVLNVLCKSGSVWLWPYTSWASIEGTCTLERGKLILGNYVPSRRGCSLIILHACRIIQNCSWLPSILLVHMDCLMFVSDVYVVSAASDGSTVAHISRFIHSTRLQDGVKMAGEFNGKLV